MKVHHRQITLLWSGRQQRSAELTGDARRRAGQIGALTEATLQFEFSHVWLLLVGAVAAE